MVHNSANHGLRNYRESASKREDGIQISVFWAVELIFIVNLRQDGALHIPYYHGSIEAAWAAIVGNASITRGKGTVKGAARVAMITA